jgi:hypothetical protein
VKDGLLDRLQFSDLVRHLLHPGHELIDAARCLFLTGGDAGTDASGESIYTSPHCVEIKLLLIWSRGAWRDQVSP